ncbi:MAG: hypothetical protein KBF15_07155 [Parabacteroides sp.]|nr:hypothetical protein [Parabacteroides sp.]
MHRGQANPARSAILTIILVVFLLSNNINLYLHLLLTKISNIMPFIIMLLMIVAACVVGFYTDNIFTATFIISEIICFLLFIIARVKEMNYLDVWITDVVQVGLIIYCFI